MKYLAKVRSPWHVMLLAMLLSIAGCANLDKKVQDVRILVPATEQASTINFIFVSPSVGLNSDPSLVQGYRLSQVENINAMRRVAGRAADFFSINGVQSRYAGSFRPEIDIKSLISMELGKASHVMIFEPVGVRTISQNGAPIGAAVRYRITLIDSKRRPILEMYDYLTASAFNSNVTDTEAAGWFNALAGNKILAKPNSGLTQPPYRDFFKESREQAQKGS